LPPVDEVKKLSLCNRMPGAQSIAISTGAFLAAFSMGYLMTR